VLPPYVESIYKTLLEYSVIPEKKDGYPVLP
jgi:hypothetical protein